MAKKINQSIFFYYGQFVFKVALFSNDGEDKSRVAIFTKIFTIIL
jgi:hypothetical protein